MKTLMSMLTESNAVHLTKIQSNYIANNFDKCKIEFDLEEGETLSMDLFLKNKRPYATIHYKDNKDSLTKDEMCMISQTSMHLCYGSYGINLKFDNCEQKISDNQTTFTFKLKGERFWSGFKWLYGEVRFIVPVDITTIESDSSKFDCKKYDKFMDTYLGEKKEYLRVIDKDDIIRYESKILNDKKTLYIDITLETGKGYSSHHRTATYKFEFEDYSYKCLTHKLYDKDYEAQIVRKFVAGVKECGCSPIPDKIEVHIEQYLD